MRFFHAFNLWQSKFGVSRHDTATDAIKVDLVEVWEHNRLLTPGGHAALHQGTDYFTLKVVVPNHLHVCHIDAEFPDFQWQLEGKSFFNFYLISGKTQPDCGLISGRMSKIVCSKTITRLYDVLKLGAMCLQNDSDTAVLRSSLRNRRN